jgi:hypothetical protein
MARTPTRKEEDKPTGRVSRACWERGQLQVQLRIPRAMAETMRKHAARETMPLASWIRYACLLELRRQKAAL